MQPCWMLLSRQQRSLNRRSSGQCNHAGCYCLTHFSPSSEKLVPSILARDYSGNRPSETLGRRPGHVNKGQTQRLHPLRMLKWELENKSG
jgi:hypothetical protein